MEIALIYHSKRVNEICDAEWAIYCLWAQLVPKCLVIVDDEYNESTQF